MATAVELDGSPLFSPAKLLVSWWMAALAIPYPIIPVTCEQIHSDHVMVDGSFSHSIPNHPCNM